MKDKILLLDIDHTILDLNRTRKFLIHKLKKLFKEDIPSIEKTTDFIINKVTKENKIFNPYMFINELAGKCSIKKNKIKNIVWTKERFKKSLYKDVKPFIKRIKGYLDIYIFSQGYIKYQKQKLAGLEGLINKKNILIFEDKKINIKRILNKFKNKKIYLIDDSPVIINFAKKVNNKIIAILMKRKNGKKYLKHKKNLADYIVKELKSAYKIIKPY